MPTFHALWTTFFTMASTPRSTIRCTGAARYHNSMPTVWVRLSSQVLNGNDETKYTNSSSSNNNSKPHDFASTHQGGKQSSLLAGFQHQHFNCLHCSAICAVFSDQREESPCGGECAHTTKNLHHCRASIRCSWSDESLLGAFHVKR
jgi:hypothetical protein